mmetsp:Transcript_16433/g.26732  ORF Transcript_16433/g.26732 Transcript_16433/m.26732 type:complete len:94 (+) Transcript_16433:3-284(+)
MFIFAPKVYMVFYGIIEGGVGYENITLNMQHEENKKKAKQAKVSPNFVDSALDVDSASPSRVLESSKASPRATAAYSTRVSKTPSLSNQTIKE